MTDKLEFKILQTCSCDYLTEGFPDNWEEMEESERTEFMEDHVWEPMEYVPVETVYEMIETAATTLQHFLMDEKFVKDNRKPRSWDV